VKWASGLRRSQVHCHSATSLLIDNLALPEQVNREREGEGTIAKGEKKKKRKSTAAIPVGTAHSDGCIRSETLSFFTPFRSESQN